MKEKSKNQSKIEHYEIMQAVLAIVAVPCTMIAFIMFFVWIPNWLFSGFPFVITSSMRDYGILGIISGAISFFCYTAAVEYLQPKIDALKGEQDTITPLIERYDQIIERLAHREADEHRLHISRTELELMVDLRVQIEKAGYTFDEDMRIVKKS